VVSASGTDALLASARTFLFVPGDQPDRFDKAFRSGADAVVVDLEDAVQPSQRPYARDEISKWYPSVCSVVDGPLVLVRVSAHDTTDHALDVAAMQRAGIEALVATKFDDEAAKVWADFGAPLVAIVETARGLRDLMAMRTVPPCVKRLAFGAVDFSADIGIDVSATNPSLVFARAQLVWASRALGLPSPIDTAFVAIGDAPGYEEDCRTTRLLGYGAKFLIHPSQIAAAALALRATPGATEWARRVVLAWDSEVNDGRGAFQLDGEMIDAAVVKRARGILAGD
jgi:citrate lyase subunit beta / citryl-CoA lyase